MANGFFDRLDDVAGLGQIGWNPNKLLVHRTPAAEIVAALHHCHARAGQAFPDGKPAQRNLGNVRELPQQFTVGCGARHGVVANRIVDRPYMSKLGNEGCVRVDAKPGFET